MEAKISHLSHCDVWSTSSFFKIGVNEFSLSYLDYEKTLTFVEFSRLNCAYFLSSEFICILNHIDTAMLYVDSELYPLALFYQSIMPRICIIRANDSLHEIKWKIDRHMQYTQKQPLSSGKRERLSKKEFTLLKSMIQGKTISDISRLTDEKYKTVHSRYLAICHKMSVRKIKRISIM